MVQAPFPEENVPFESRYNHSCPQAREFLLAVQYQL